MTEALQPYMLVIMLQGQLTSRCYIPHCSSTDEVYMLETNRLAAVVQVYGWNRAIKPKARQDNKSKH